MKTRLTLKEVVALPAVDRPKGTRQPLVSYRRLAFSAAAVFGVLVVASVGFIGVRALVTTSTPSVVGLSIDLARTRLSRQNMSLVVETYQYATAEKGEILSQVPAPGATMARGGTIQVTVSAGSQTFAMPDTVGDARIYAETILKQWGLDVSVVEQPSDGLSGVVLSSSPSGGSTVRTGDQIVLRISIPRERVPLVEWDLEGHTVVIEPLYTPDNEGDVTRDVALRLSSLLEAGGAEVVVTRESYQEAVGSDEYLQRAINANPSAHIIIDLSTSAKSHLVVSGSTKSSTGKTLTERTYAYLSKVAPEAQIEPRTLDTGAPANMTVLVGLGKTTSKENAVLYNDSRWRDGIARSLYLAVGESLAAE